MHPEYAKHLFGNIMCAVDVETTALDPRKGEICQLAIVPVDLDCRPSKRLQPFNRYFKINKPGNCDPESMKIHGITLEKLEKEGLDPEDAVEAVIQWFESLLLPEGKNIVPLAHNYPYEHSHLPQFLGFKLDNRIFHGHYRCGMNFANCINDKYALAGEAVPFKNVGLKKLCEFFKVVNEKPHDALYDCLAEIEVYRNLLQYDL